MMELEIGGQRYPIPTGEAVLGSDPSCAIHLELVGVLPRHARFTVDAEGSTAVRQATPEAELFLNSVRLGAEPAPILHGDKLQVGPLEILCTDPRRSGSTQFVNAADVAKMAMGGRPGGAAKPPTASTGGRLVCLTDGREYTIGAHPVVFGREAGCDIVVPNKDVSRRHAEIMATPQGYVVVDSSTNGTFVNGEPVNAQRLLSRADVIRVGDHDFRFYADAAAAAPAAVPSPPAPETSRPLELMSIEPSAGPVPMPVSPQVVASAPNRESTPTPASGAQPRLHDTLYGSALPPIPPPAPAAPPAAPVRPSVAAPPAPRPSAATSPPLASMLVRTGSLKGTRFQVRVPVVNIGRADYNDLVIPDESVSTQHAKLQRREEVWMLTDLGSTNGTFVDGERIAGETAISPGAAIRFGEISLMFEPTDDDAEVSKAGGTKVLQAAFPSPPPPPPSPPPAPRPPPPAASRPAVAPEPSPKPASRKPGVIIASPPPKSAAKWLIPVSILVIIVAIALVLIFR